MTYSQLIQCVISELCESPVDILGIGDFEGERKYLEYHRDSYERTIKDIDELLKRRRRETKILEIGSFLGPVSISLKRLGYKVFALDIPEFSKSQSLQKLKRSTGPSRVQDYYLAVL